MITALALAALLTLSACDIFIDCGAGPCPEVVIIHQTKATTTSPTTEAQVPLIP